MYCVCKLFTCDCRTHLTQIGINQHSKSFKMHSPQRFMQFGLPFKVVLVLKYYKLPSKSCHYLQFLYFNAHPMLISMHQYLSCSWNVLKNLKGKKTMNKSWRKSICRLFKTMYIVNIKEESVTIFYHKEAKTRWTNSDLLEISLFSNLFQRYKFSLTQSEIPWLFTSFGVIYFYLTFCHLKQACLQLSCRKQWTIHLWNTCNL